MARLGVRQHDASSDRAVAIWLLCCAAMVLLIVVIGGVTRLTESGLSITEWKPVSGVLPPLTAEHWDAEFAKYQRTTEYQLVNRGMSLSQFKLIFFWEYLHRLWGRLVGLAFALPLVVFLVQKRIAPPMQPRLAAIFVLILLQGALGWFMVQSGLSGRTDVSQYRLAAHLSLALIIYALLVWNGLSLLSGSDPPRKGAADAVAGAPGLHTRALILIAFVSTTIVSGAFVAGLNAGEVYNSFPLMGGRIAPREYMELSPWYLNFFENAGAVQFNHRLLALLTLAVAVYVYVWSRKRALPALARVGVQAMAIVAVLQVLLGITTLLYSVPIPLAAAHQTGAVLLLTASIVALRGAR